MAGLYEMHRKVKEKEEHLKRQIQLRKKKERESKRKQDDSRNFIVGGLVTKYFPEIRRYQPRRNKAENAKEFETLENLLSAVSSNSEIMAQIRQLAESLDDGVIMPAKIK